MAPTEAEVREVAKVISRYDCEGVSDHEPNRHAAEALYVARIALIAAERVREDAERKQQALDDARINKSLYGEARTQEVENEREDRVREEREAALAEKADAITEARTQPEWKCSRNPPCPEGECRFRDPGCPKPETGQPFDGGKVVRSTGEARTQRCDCRPVIQEQMYELCARNPGLVPPPDATLSEPETGQREYDYYEDGIKSERTRIVALIEGMTKYEHVSTEYDLDYNKAIDEILTAIQEANNGD